MLPILPNFSPDSHGGVFSDLMPQHVFKMIETKTTSWSYNMAASLDVQNQLVNILKQT